MNSSYFLLIRYLFSRNPPRSIRASVATTLLGIALATAVLLITVSVTMGFESAYKRSILDFNAHIAMLKSEGEMVNYNQLIDELTKVEGVNAATPFIYRESMIVHKGMVKGVVIKGVDFQRLSDVSNILIKLFDPGTPARQHASTVFLGSHLAQKLGIDKPTEVNLLLGTNRFQRVFVGGVFESGLYDYDSKFALMSISDVQGLFGGMVTGVEMSVKDINNASIVADNLRALYNGYQVTSWEELNQPIFEAVHIEKIMFIIIIGVLVLVAVFNIIGTLILKFIYRLKDIAILGAIGMEAIKIRRLFTFQGLVLGVVGCFIGLVAGGIFTYLIGRLELVKIEPEIYFLSRLPVVIDWSVFFAVLVVCAFVSWLVSYMVAKKAISNVSGQKSL